MVSLDIKEDTRDQNEDREEEKGCAKEAERGECESGERERGAKERQRNDTEEGKRFLLAFSSSEAIRVRVTESFLTEQARKALA